MLKEVLDAALARKRLSVRAAARQIGIAHTTLNRVLVGGPIDLETVMKISAWMGVRPAVLLDMESGGEAEIVELVPGLKEVLSEARLLIEGGKVPASILDDITAFARFKISEYSKDDKRS
jgi:plasmid maintenance system antidote protein VapI